MTVVVLVRNNGKIWIGADTIRTFGTHHNEGATPKIWSTRDKYDNEWVFGSAGAAEVQQVAQYLLPDFEEDISKSDDQFGFVYRNVVLPLYAKLKELGQVIDSDPNKGETSAGTLAVGVVGKLFLITAFSVFEETRDFLAQGLGGPPAHGALHTIESLGLDLSPEKRIRTAIAAATAFTPVIGGRIDILHT